MKPIYFWLFILNNQKFYISCSNAVAIYKDNKIVIQTKECKPELKRQKKNLCVANGKNISTF